MIGLDAPEATSSCTKTKQAARFSGWRIVSYRLWNLKKSRLASIGRTGMSIASVWKSAQRSFT